MQLLSRAIRTLKPPGTASPMIGDEAGNISPVRSGAHCTLRADLAHHLPKPLAFDDVLTISGDVYREMGVRCTQRFELGGQPYFIKVHRGVGWREILKNLLYLRLPILGARNELRAIHRAAELGVASMSVAGFGQRGINPASQESFLITDALEQTVSLEDFCRNWKQHPPAFRLKRILIERVATIARQLHENGINHRDFYLCHFLLRQDSVIEPIDVDRVELYVIDLHRAQIRRRVPRRWLVKDVAGLYFSSLDIGLTRTDLFRFMKTYRQQPLRTTLRKDRRLWQQVSRSGMALYRRIFKREPGTSNAIETA